MATTKAVESEILSEAMKRVATEQAQPVEEPEMSPGRPNMKTKNGTKTKVAPAAAELATITYIPRVEGDPAFTVWQKVRFKANVPVETRNSEMIDAAKRNPWFSVDGATPAPLAAKAPPRDTSEDVQSKSEKDLGGKEIEAEAELAEPFVDDN